MKRNLQLASLACRISQQESDQIDQLNQKFFQDTKTRSEFGRFLVQIALQTIQEGKVKVVQRITVDGKDLK